MSLGLRLPLSSAGLPTPWASFSAAPLTGLAWVRSSCVCVLPSWQMEVGCSSVPLLFQRFCTDRSTLR